MKSENVNAPKRTKTKRQKWSFVLYILVAVVTVYVLFTIVGQQISIINKRTELEEIQQKVYTQEQTNAELKKVADAVKENRTDDYAGYIEDEARRKFDYVKAGEVVFVNIAGD